ncbi:zf-HC2 domain-containing protein [Herbiconiux sp. VKM Ac-1786]|jgi:anti-sigma factor (TIGR02949 family)|uniref:zf-HC2 domain-containing protein n=1 Tax=Herbiconiux sp. VKM Ac-1786 TaxID=2783824 RepID=UPI00188AD030|nr:zf-HC2 domain-containing protein [Herbiconiux sp. VKM Ac-1786]MBF4573842.1 zf-HC2 domain-containing protein [Herbiconiux sp. VKM Ac-1786]
MSDCGCDKARAELEEYLRNEICTTDAADIRDHLETCEGCQSELHIGVVLTQTVQRACKETAPEELRDQLLARLREVQTH